MAELFKSKSLMVAAGKNPHLAARMNILKGLLQRFKRLLFCCAAVLVAACGRNIVHSGIDALLLRNNPCQAAVSLLARIVHAARQHDAEKDADHINGTISFEFICTSTFT